MALLLYAVTAAALLWLSHRYVTPLDRISAAILFLLPFCFAGKALLTGGVYAPVDLIYVAPPFSGMKALMGVSHINGYLSDVVCQMLPWRAAVRNVVMERVWPLWNPFIFSGDILAATAQPAVYSPFTWIALLIAQPAVSMTYSAVLYHFIAALTAFLFARELGCRGLTAWFAAAAFTFATAMTIFVLWPDGQAFAFFPLVLLATRRVSLQPSVRSAALLMIAFALMIATGHPETLVHTVAIAAPYGIYLLVRKRHDIVRAIAFAAAAGIVALALSAVQLLPLIEAMPQSMEYQYRHGYWRHIVHAANPGEQRARLLCDLFPYFLGRHWRDATITQVPFDSMAVGSLVLPLAFYGLLRGRTNERWFFLAVVLFAIPARLGLRWFGALMRPILGLNIAINERFAFAAAFALALLAAFGLEAWLDRPRDRALVAAMIVVAIALGAGTWYFAGHDPTDANPGWTSYPIIGELVPLFVAIAVVLFARSAAAVPSLLVLLAVQRLVTVGMIYPTLPARITYPGVPMFSMMKKTSGPFRVVGVGASLIPATATIYGFEDVRGYSALTFMRYVETFPLWCKEQPVWWNRVDDLTKPFLAFLNVRYAVTGMSDPPPGWHVVAEEYGSRIFENERVLPRAFVPKWTRVGRTTPVDSTLAEMQNATDFGERAWIETSMSLHDERNGPGTVTAIESRGNGFRIRVVMEKAGRVIVSEPAWSGWRAYIDGRRVEMQIANIAFLAIYVPAGPHTIRLVYLPESFVIGRAISLVTLAVLIVALLLNRRPKSSRASS